jgi:hypothetical protein
VLHCECALVLPFGIAVVASQEGNWDDRVVLAMFGEDPGGDRHRLPGIVIVSDRNLHRNNPDGRFLQVHANANARGKLSYKTALSCERGKKRRRYLVTALSFHAAVCPRGALVVHTGESHSVLGGADHTTPSYPKITLLLVIF